MKRIRLRYALVAVACLGAIAVLVAGPLTDNIVYFRTVPEALALRDDGDTSRFRLAGLVVDGSVTETATGVEFDVTDGEQIAHVVHGGDPPQLFAPGTPVVCEGRWDGAAFTSDRIMIRHGNEYEEYVPPEVTTTVARAPAPPAS